MASLVKCVKCGAINTSDTSKSLFYVIMFTLEESTIQNNATIDRKNVSAGELVVKAQYFCSIQEITNGFWDKYSQQQVNTVLELTIPYPRLGVIAIIDIHDINKNLCNRTQAKKAISRYHIFLTNSDENYILE